MTKSIKNSFITNINNKGIPIEEQMTMLEKTL